MQSHRVRGSGDVRRVWRAGVLAVAFGGTASLVDAQVTAAVAENATKPSAVREHRSPSATARPIVAGRGKTTMIIGGTVTSTDLDNFGGVDDRLLSILALVPRVAIGHNVTDRVAVEVPFSIQSVKPEDDDRFNSIDLAVRPVFAFASAEGARGVLTVMGRVNRLSGGDASSNRFGYELGVGPEFRINDALSFRGTFVYGSLAEDDDVGLPKETYYGLNLDLVHNLSATGPVHSGGFTIRTGASFTSLSPDDADGQTAIEIPTPFLGLLVGVGETGRIRIGGEVEIERHSLGDFSEMELTLLPTIEYDLGPADRLGFRLRGLGLLSRLSFDSGSSDQSGTITGFGAGGAIVLPMFDRYLGVFGLDYLKTQENEDLGAPSANVIRATFGVELGF